MGWGDVEKGPLGQGGGGRFLSIEPGETVTLRSLDEEPFTYYAHKVSQVVGGQEVFRTIPATEDIDDNFIQNGSRRWPATPIHNLRVIVIEGGEPVGDILVLSGGKQIFEPLKTIHDRYGDIRELDIDITRKGKGLKTEYHVSIAGKHAKISKADFDSLLEELETDTAIQWETMFRTPTGEQQEKLFKEAGFDIDYDPAEDLAEEMELDEALAVQMPTGGGKYPGKTMRELVVVDLGYLQWVAGNYTSDDRVAAAARVVTRNLDEVEKLPSGRRGAIRGETTDTRSGGQRERDRRRTSRSEDQEDEGEEEEPETRPSAGGGGRASSRRSAATRPTTTEEDDPDAEEEAPPRTTRRADSAAKRGGIIEEINGLLSELPKYEDGAALVKLVKGHSGGKTRIRDMDADQLLSMRDALIEEKSASAPRSGRRARGR